MYGRDTERQVRKERPVILRDNVIPAVRAMCVRIDIARHQCLSSQIDLCCIVGDGNVTCGAQRHNAIVLNDDNAIIDDISRRIHGDDASIGKGHKSAGTI